jgi:hypothetical protein
VPAGSFFPETKHTQTFSSPRMSEVIELLSDSDLDSNKSDHGVVNDNNQPSVLSVAIEGKPHTMPRPAFMSWFCGKKLFQHVVQKASPKKLEFCELCVNHLEQVHGLSRSTFPIFHNEPVAMQMIFFQ